MTNVEYMEIAARNTESGSYERTGTSGKQDAFFIGDAVETDLFPANTLDAAVTATEG